MHLNPESLSFALLISDLGSIARTANILGMKQATLSPKLTALESRVGVRLFDRSTRGAVPTVSGAGFLNQARRIVADLDTLLTSSRAAASGEEGKLGIGFSTSLAAGGMRALILELIQTLPGAQLSGFERGRRRLSQALYAGTIDFAVLSGDLVLEAMTRKALWAERIMIALPQDHLLLAKDRLHWVDLRKHRFIISCLGDFPGFRIARHRLAVMRSENPARPREHMSRCFAEPGNQSYAWRRACKRLHGAKIIAGSAMAIRLT